MYHDYDGNISYFKGKYTQMPTLFYSVPATEVKDIMSLKFPQAMFSILLNVYSDTVHISTL